MSIMTRFRSLVTRFVMVAIICSLFIISHVQPAAAIGSTRSNPSKGAEPLDNIYERSERVLDQEPRSGDAVTSDANRGINEIQGSADAERMSTPSNSRQATSVEEQVKDILENVTGK